MHEGKLYYSMPAAVKQLKVNYCKFGELLNSVKLVTGGAVDD